MESVFLSWIGLNEDDILSQLRFNCPKKIFYIYIIQLFKKYSKAGWSLWFSGRPACFLVVTNFMCFFPHKIRSQFLHVDHFMYDV